MNEAESEQWPVRKRTETRFLLAEDPALYRMILARLIEPVEDSEDSDSGWKPPRPWEVLKEMGLSWGAFMDWVDDPDHGERRVRFDLCLRTRAHVYKEQTIDIADGVAEDRAAIAKAKLRNEARDSVAAAWDKGRYAPSTKLDVSMKGGSLIAVLAALDAQPVEQAGSVIEHEAVPALPRPKLEYAEL